jgi:hypothetical protein
MTKSSSCDPTESGVGFRGHEPVVEPSKERSGTEPSAASAHGSIRDAQTSDRKKNDLEWAMVEALMRCYNE